MSNTMYNTNVMVDLETLGTSPGCKILSIGAITFDDCLASQTFYVEVSRHRGQDMLHEDPATLDWWERQSPEAKTLLNTPDARKLVLAEALVQFNAWLLEVTERADISGNLKMALWGNGADFDNAVLAYAYKAVGITPVWPYWGNRCYRTLKNLAPGVPLVRAGVHHNALDDARSQATHAAQIFKELKLWP